MLQAKKNVLRVCNARVYTLQYMFSMLRDNELNCQPNRALIECFIRTPVASYDQSTSM